MTAGAEDLRIAYGRSATAWAAGPGRIYDHLAAVLVAEAPVSLRGGVVADVGAGRGAVTRALLEVGAAPLALDLSEGMLRADDLAPRAAADARALPLRARSLRGVVAGFSFNHVPDPAAALAEAARVTRPGGVVLASAYASDDHHPVKEAVDGAAGSAGWRPDGWVERLRNEAVPKLATPSRARLAVRAAGLADAVVTTVEVPFPDLQPPALVDWRLGMATVAPWVASLDGAARERLRDDALERLGPAPPPLVRRMVVIAAVVS